jgi:hypothetical protein
MGHQTGKRLTGTVEYWDPRGAGGITPDGSRFTLSFNSQDIKDFERDGCPRLLAPGDRVSFIIDYRGSRGTPVAAEVRRLGLEDRGTSSPDQSRRVRLDLDERTARLLCGVLAAGGEHQAAGVPMPVLDREDSERLADVMKQLVRGVEGLEPAELG